MIQLEGLEENFQFLVVEVQSQLQRIFRFLAAPDDALYRRIVDKDDYIDNLKTVIENKCFSKIHTDDSLTEKQVHTIRAMHIMCVNLERIADFCVNIACQMEYLSDPGFIESSDYLDIFLEAQQSLSRILPVLHTRDMAGAVSVCRSEHRIDILYKQNFTRIMADICKGRNPQDHLTLIFILRYLERIGDSLLNIGEALIFAILGEKIKIDQLDSLRASLAKAGYGEGLGEVEFKSIWGTRSGCRIGSVHAADGLDPGDADGRLYKEGTREKIAREKANLKRWDQVMPGLVPKVFNYAEEGDKASLLVQFLPGSSMDEVILAAEEPLLEVAVDRLAKVVEAVFLKTLKPEPAQSDFMEQVDDRLEGIVGMHPDFFRKSGSMGRVRIESTRELVARCKEVQNRHPAPFTVFTHGDFNANNIVFNPAEKSVHYIDVYRSRQADYVQDASVFLISNFRMPVFEQALRQRINRVIEKTYALFSGFAKAQNDDGFPLRMALGLARSFLTSTRFELNSRFANDMFLRAHFLMERVAAHEGENFSLPTDILFY